MKSNKTVFPSPYLIYEKGFIIENEKKIKEKEEKNNMQKKIIYPIRKQSRFDFVSNTNVANTSVDVPIFIHSIIKKRFFSLDKQYSDDWGFCYLDKTLVREYTENNDWARFIVNINNPKKNELMRMIEEEEKKLLNKFKSA